MGESGIIFMGLRPYHIIKVTGFISSLNDVSIKLTFNDRSMELMADIETKKSEREDGRLTVERL